MKPIRHLLTRWRIVVPAGVLTAGVLAAGAYGLDSRVGAASAPTASTTLSAPAPEPALAPLATASYADTVAQALPAVVTVQVERRAEMAPAMQIPADPFFQRFFGPAIPNGPRGEAPLEAGLGSGVIVSTDGTILTNNHVVDSAEHLNVVLGDGREFTAKVVGTDEPTDLAVIKIDGHDLPTIPLADSDRVRVGDVVLAVGNPLGVGQTVTMGIISAKNRTTGSGNGTYEDFLQTDAPINHGNSGGALITTGGELVGINSQILSPSQEGGNIGIGFAIPSNLAKNVMTQLTTTGRVRRGKLGVTVQPVNSALAESLGLGSVQGAIVASVEPDSPAAQAGMEAGDVILHVNGASVDDSNDLRNRISTMAPGDTANLDVLRDGQHRQIAVTLGEMSADTASSAPASSEGGELGMTLQTITPDLANRFNLSRGATGVLVTDVEVGSVAAHAGLRPGDVIRSVNGQSVDTPQQVRSGLNTPGGRPPLLRIERDGQPLFVAVPRS